MHVEDELALQKALADPQSVDRFIACAMRRVGMARLVNGYRDINFGAYELDIVLPALAAAWELAKERKCGSASNLSSTANRPTAQAGP